MSSLRASSPRASSLRALYFEPRVLEPRAFELCISRSSSPRISSQKIGTFWFISMRHRLEIPFETPKYNISHNIKTEPLEANNENNGINDTAKAKLISVVRKVISGYWLVVTYTWSTFLYLTKILIFRKWSQMYSFSYQGYSWLFSSMLTLRPARTTAR